MVKRGEIWAGAGGDFASKARPVLVLQDDAFPDTEGLTVIPFTSDMTEAPLLRLPVQPNADNGLSKPSSLMVDKVTTTKRSKVRARIGCLSEPEMAQVAVMVATFLGLARGPSGKRAPARRATAKTGVAKARVGEAPAAKAGKAKGTRTPPRRPT